LKHKKICFVVHRYAPFPGGSEYYVQQMAEECYSRGFDVTVVAGEHAGDLNGVKVTSEAKNLLGQDLIVVHGGDVGVQNFVLHNAKNIDSSILYLLIKPSDSEICVKALYDVKYVGCSTHEDWNHVKKYGVENKAVRVVHGTSPIDSIGTKDSFKSKFNIPENKRMFLSCGGYWHNKKMIELADTFEKSNLQDSILVITGYDNRYNLKPISRNNIISLMLDDPKDVKNAISDADCYVMNSDSEGFGLVILESMINKTPWISRNIAGARLLSHFGQTFNTEDELLVLLKNFEKNNILVDKAYDFVIKNHLIKNTVDDIIKVLEL